MTYKISSSLNLLYHCETWASLVEHNADTLAGIQESHMKVLSNHSESCFFNFYSYLLPPSEMVAVSQTN